ncbi:MAG TPA: hypothetical protein VIV60_31105 [Polyangiaceae bacterium]
MKQVQWNFTRKAHALRALANHTRMVVGGSILFALVFASGTGLAEPKAGPGADTPPHGLGKKGGASPKELFGGPSGHRKGEHGDNANAPGDAHPSDHHGHGIGVAGAPGTDGHHHGMGAELLQKRLTELKQKQAAGSLTPAENQELERLEKMPKLPIGPAHRKARLAELSEKESSGKLSGDEKSELANLKQVEARHEAMAKRFAEMAQQRKDRSRDAKRRALNEFPHLDKDASALAEYQKHADRLAKLERAKDLASADQRAELLQKIDALIAKENERHQSWLSKHKPNTQATSQGAAQ